MLMKCYVKQLRFLIIMNETIQNLLSNYHKQSTNNYNLKQMPKSFRYSSNPKLSKVRQKNWQTYQYTYLFKKNIYYSIA